MTNRFLDKNWLASHLTQIKAKAGHRYTPELNIDLPLAKIFDGMGKTDCFYTTIRTHFGKLEREFQRISGKYDSKLIQKKYAAFSKQILVLLKILKSIKEYDALTIQWKVINQLAEKINETSWELTEKLREEKERAEKQKNPVQTENRASPSEKLSFDIHNLHEAQKELRYFADFSLTTTAQLSNNPFLLLRGLAGSGKTHLLCDVVEKRAASSLPAILVFGEFFSSGEVWQQIATQLNLSRSYDKDKILGKLDEAGKRAKARSFIIIDAINESRPSSFWRKTLKELAREVAGYPNIALIISIRSGFEKEVLPKNLKKRFVVEEHHGFQFQEWEAVTKFFHEFSLPLPEIPLLMPEFQNPLFLLLFCKAFQDRAKQNRSKKPKQIFRGHEGATYIFENFVKSVADRVADQFKLPKGRGKNGDYVIWDTVIEKVAAEMVAQNRDRISEDMLVNIVQTTHPEVSCVRFISALEKNFLLVKIPRYSTTSDKIDGFDYRFPFQKFSEHLIGRYIFKQFKTTTRTPRQFFGKNTRIGKFIGGNIGIVEALSIQCPEWLKGIEFFEVAPHVTNWMLVKAFNESLVWRKPDAFSKDLQTTFGFINQSVITSDEGYDSLLNTFLSVAAVPGHPFNAQFLHRYLAKFSMPKRDSLWTTFLHYQYGEHGAVDRLIEWGCSTQDKRHISDKSIQLYSIALGWFLASSNRFLRDRTTKALVALLTDRLVIIIELLEQFKRIDDPYVLERLYAVAYGCSLRNKDDKEGLKELAAWFLNNVFKTGQVPTHILMRDYARGVIEVAIKHRLINYARCPRITPPYGSKWPGKIPTAKTLKRKYYPNDLASKQTEDRGFLSIWSSVMHAFGSLGDFGNYEVDSKLGHWSGRKLGGSKIPRKEYFEKFKKELTSRQLRFFNKTNPLYGIDFHKIVFASENASANKKVENNDEMQIEKLRQNEKQEQKKAFAQFKKTLTAKKRGIFEKEIEPYLGDRGEITDPLDRFNTGLGQRWIFNRVAGLGWDPKLHGQFDGNLNVGRYDRSAHKAERIGKKYQWIALHELLALVADNFEFIGNSWSDKVSTYEGTWQIGVRDIDPSCILQEVCDVKTHSLPVFSAYKPIYNPWKLNKSIKTWLKEIQNLPNPTSIIELTDKSGHAWVVLEGYCEWEETTPPEFEKYQIPIRKLYYMIKSYLVRKDANKTVFAWGKKQRFYGRWMPESHQFDSIYLGEYPSSPAFLDHYTPYYHHEGWTCGRNPKKIPAKILVTDDEYLSSGSSIDCSTDETLTVQLPAKWIVDNMGIVQKYTDGRFFNKTGELVAFDPKVFTKDSPAFLLMRKDKLCRFLQQKKYAIFWTLSGEKQTLGGGGIGQPYGWQEISGCYSHNKDNKIKGTMAAEFKQPTPQTRTFNFKEKK